MNVIWISVWFTEHKKQESSHSSKEMISNSAPNEYLNSIPVTQSNSSPLKRTESCPAMTEKPSLIQSNAAELPSPSASPLSQSWEEPTKMTLTSVKGRSVSHTMLNCWTFCENLLSIHLILPYSSKSYFMYIL